MVGLLHISAEEVNCLIYAYFKDSGFQHSAFVLRAEGQLEHSNVFRKHVPRGELIELLSKALLFSEVEAHWKGDKMSMSCHNPFKLLEHHVCSSPPPHLATAPSQPPMPASSAPNGSSTAHRHLPADNALKRKAGGTPVLEESPKEKRAKTRSPVEVEVAATSEPSLESRSVVAHPSVAAHENTSTVTQASQQHHKTEPDTAERETDETFVQTLKGHKAEAFVCSWNPVHTSTLASGSKDSVVQLWNIPGPDPNGDIQSQTALPITCDYPSKEEHGDLTSLDWSADGSLLAIGCYDSVLRICDTNGRMYFSHSQHDGPIFAARFSPGGRWLATASLDGSVCVWDVQGKRLHRHYVVHEKCCLDVDWLSESEFATSGSDGLVQIMNINNPSPLKTLSGHKNEVNQVRSNPSRTRLASCSDDRTARIWNIEDIVYDRPQNDRVLLLRGHREAVSNIAWCPFTASGDHEMIVTSSFDHTTRIWDTVTGQCLKEFDDHKSSVYSLACSPDGRYFASAGGDGGVYIYNVQTKQKVWSYNAGRSVFELAWQQTDNYNRIAIAMLNGNVSVVDLTRIQELQ